MKRVGLLGGAFNPPHLGHLKLAELALHHLELDEVRFVPTARSPHKAHPEGSPDEQARLRLLRDALNGIDLPFVADPIELNRGGTSYTVDTLEALSVQAPDCRWILLLGSDQLPGLAAWQRAPRVLELAALAVAPRPGFSLELAQDLEGRVKPSWSGAPGEVVWLPGTNLSISSSASRERIFRGDELEGLSPQVQAAIRRENYYR